MEQRLVADIRVIMRLRIDEALSLNRCDMPGETLLVTGKGQKQRMIPVLPVVRAFIGA